MNTFERPDISRMNGLRKSFPPCELKMISLRMPWPCSESAMSFRSANRVLG
jgi:hypothetical protein